MLGKQIIELDNYEKCWIGWLIKPYKVNQIKYLVKRRYGEDGKFEHISVYFINDYLEDCVWEWSVEKSRKDKNEQSNTNWKNID